MPRSDDLPILFGLRRSLGTLCLRRSLALHLAPGLLAPDSFPAVTDPFCCWRLSARPHCRFLGTWDRRSGSGNKPNLVARAGRYSG
jgi:hypothetical protein